MRLFYLDMTSPEYLLHHLHSMGVLLVPGDRPPKIRVIAPRLIWHEIPHTDIVCLEEHLFPLIQDMKKYSSSRISKRAFHANIEIQQDLVAKFFAALDVEGWINAYQSADDDPGTALLRNRAQYYQRIEDGDFPKYKHVVEAVEALAEHYGLDVDPPLFMPAVSEGSAAKTLTDNILKRAGADLAEDGRD